MPRTRPPIVIQPYQQRWLDAFREHPRVLLIQPNLGMGTREAMAYYVDELSAKGEKTLIVTPSVLRHEWESMLDRPTKILTPQSLWKIDPRTYGFEEYMFVDVGCHGPLTMQALRKIMLNTERYVVRTDAHNPIERYGTPDALVMTVDRDEWLLKA